MPAPAAPASHRRPALNTIIRQRPSASAQVGVGALPALGGKPIPDSAPVALVAGPSPSRPAHAAPTSHQRPEQEKRQHMDARASVSDGVDLNAFVYHHTFGFDRLEVVQRDAQAAGGASAWSEREACCSDAVTGPARHRFASWLVCVPLPFRARPRTDFFRATRRGSCSSRMPLALRLFFTAYTVSSMNLARTLARHGAMAPVRFAYV